MSTLILTCDTGEGHNSCAKAIKEVYDTHGIPCEIINPVRFVAEWFARFVHWTHTTMYQKLPKVFTYGYCFTQSHSRWTTARGSFPYWVLSFGAKKLHDYIVRKEVSFTRMMKYIILTYIATIVIYLLWPTCQQLRPESFDRDNFLIRFIAGFYQFDTNTNVCPSIHVIGSLAVIEAGLWSKRLSIEWKAWFVITAILVCISTVFMKQHSVLDIFAAIPICILAHFQFFRKEKDAC